MIIRTKVTAAEYNFRIMLMPIGKKKIMEVFVPILIEGKKLRLKFPL
jgi:hypothetical protein